MNFMERKTEMKKTFYNTLLKIYRSPREDLIVGDNKAKGAFTKKESPPR